MNTAVCTLRLLLLDYFVTGNMDLKLRI